MTAFLERIERPMMAVAGKLGQQPHLNAIRDGVVGALPLVLIGSLFLLLAQPPLGSQAALDAYMQKHAALIGHMLTVFRVLVGLISIFVAFGVAHSLAKRYDLDALSAGLLAVAALLLMNGLQSVSMVTPEGLAQLKAAQPITGDHVAVGRFAPIANLGAGGMFMAIFLGLIVPEVQRLARKYKLEIRMPDGVPPAVGRSFSALIPGLIVIVPLWALVYLAGVDLFGVIATCLTQPIQALSASGTSVFFVLLAIIILDSILWLLGVHAVAILAPMAAIWLANIAANGDAVAAGQSARYLNTREALTFFVWLGGSGATLVLPFLMLRAKSAALRAVAKVGMVPALFNINEPLIFGVPVVMNPTLLIPFILAPIITLGTTTLAMHLQLVPIPSVVVPWTLPGPIGAFLTTQYAWQAIVLSVVNIALAALIYWPFVRMLDRRMAAQEAAAEA